MRSTRPARPEDIARAGHRVLRRLADDPLVYHDDLDAAERDWLGPRWQVANRLAAELGLTLERRAEGFTAIDRSIAEPMTDDRFPAAGSTVAHCAAARRSTWSTATEPPASRRKAGMLPPPSPYRVQRSSPTSAS